jgi:hypothetical protein
MDIILQAWGGGFYLLNKIFLALAEGKKPKTKRQLKIIGWIIYILGVPAWVIILFSKHAWIAASVEVGGIPSMLLGVLTAYRGHNSSNRALDLTASISTYVFLILGVCYSVYDYRGITSISQLLEMGVMFGFLTGSYLLAKNNSSGWLFFILMNGSMAALMFMQHKPLLSIQQLVSLGFVLYGFTVSLKTTQIKS